MSEKLGILFLHHDLSAVAQNNLRSVRKENPGATVVTMSAGEAWPGGYSIEATPAIKVLHAVNTKRSSDWLVCSWFTQRREKCDKWWIIEWDVFCTVPVREYYAPVWHFPFVVSGVRYLYREPEWGWFSHRDKLPEEYWPYAMGAAPFLYLLDDEALGTICATHLKKPFTVGNGELRFTTVANKCGYPPCGYSPPEDYIGWLPWTEVPKHRRGIFHPVKYLVDYEAMKKRKVRKQKEKG